MSKFNDRVQRAINLAKQKPRTIAELATDFDIEYYRTRTVAAVACEVDGSLELNRIRDLVTLKDGPWYLATREWFEGERARKKTERDARYKLPEESPPPPLPAEAPPVLFTRPEGTR